MCSIIINILNIGTQLDFVVSNHSNIGYFHWLEILNHYGAKTEEV